MEYPLLDHAMHSKASLAVYRQSCLHMKAPHSQRFTSTSELKSYYCITN